MLSKNSLHRTLWYLRGKYGVLNVELNISQITKSVSEGSVKDSIDYDKTEELIFISIKNIKDIYVLFKNVYTEFDNTEQLCTQLGEVDLLISKECSDVLSIVYDKALYFKDLKINYINETEFLEIKC